MDIWRTILGLLLALFLPGALIVLIFFDELSFFEKVAVAIALSIAIMMFIGIALGYDQNVAALTGGINEYNVWKYSMFTSAGLAVILIGKAVYVKWPKKH
jgi:uncharacterized membrane protein